MDGSKLGYLDELFRHETEKLKEDEKGLTWRIVFASLALTVAIIPNYGSFSLWAWFVFAPFAYGVFSSTVRINRRKSYLDNIRLQRFVCSRSEG